MIRPLAAITVDITLKAIVRVLPVLVVLDKSVGVGVGYMTLPLMVIFSVVVT